MGSSFTTGKRTIFFLSSNAINSTIISWFIMQRHTTVLLTRLDGSENFKRMIAQKIVEKKSWLDQNYGSSRKIVPTCLKKLEIAGTQSIWQRKWIYWMAYVWTVDPSTIFLNWFSCSAKRSLEIPPLFIVSWPLPKEIEGVLF